MRRLLYLSTIVADLGSIFFFIAPLTALPLVVTLLFSEWGLFFPMAAVPALFFSLGILLKRLPRNERENRLSTTLCSVALFWFTCAMVSGIPFLLGAHMGFTDALFEGMAGWTGTAFTLMPSLDTAPHTLLFWRSFMQWMGGIGTIAFVIALASSTGLFQGKIYRTESRDEPLMPSILSKGRAIWKIYGLLTFLAIGLILFTGLSLWDSVNLALTTISTGGFVPHDGGILSYNNIFLEVLLIPLMIAGALPFRLYYLIGENRRWSLFGDEQVKLFLVVTALGTAVLTYDLVYFNNLNIGSALFQGVFMTVSALTTTGFQIVDLQTWASVTLFFLMMLVFIGGTSGSSAGGIKLNRVMLGLRALVWWFRRLFVSGKVLIPFRSEGRVIPRATAELETAKTMLVIILSVVVIFIAAIIVLQFQQMASPINGILFDVTSAFSTCGISTGYVTPGMPLVSKWVFIIVMWLGRLEVIPVLVLFMALLRGSD
ncbi:TrkH family potassium uptake protein [Methanoregula sp.]|uniref:TrkH family potassium uptake protein n=1 Tax=Methanoregula sp. TaxID=2052170 RepID=UPI002CBF0875|nr:TrkH family potassium uptake protein [Methanoregula sp.]HVP97091.1 TrkH family potassium uptake protein [Methanoregula sp.]